MAWLLRLFALAYSAVAFFFAAAGIVLIALAVAVPLAALEIA